MASSYFTAFWVPEGLYSLYSPTSHEVLVRFAKSVAVLVVIVLNEVETEIAGELML